MCQNQKSRSPGVQLCASQHKVFGKQFVWRCVSGDSWRRPDVVWATRGPEVICVGVCLHRKFTYIQASTFKSFAVLSDFCKTVIHKCVLYLLKTYLVQ